jgi:hypothetical protein
MKKAPSDVGAFLLIVDDDLFDFVSLLDLVYDIQAFHYFAEASVVSVQMAGVVPAVADEELAASGVSSGMGHG